MTASRTQLKYLETSRNYARQGNKRLFAEYLNKAEAAKPMTFDQYAKMLNVWTNNNEDWYKFAPANRYAIEEE